MTASSTGRAAAGRAANVAARAYSSSTEHLTLAGAKRVGRTVKAAMDALPSEGVTLTLPEPPSANRYWRVFKGRVVKSKAAREYAKAVKAAAKKVLGDGPEDYSAWNGSESYFGTSRAPFTGPVIVTIHWCRAKKMGDLANREKVVCDAVQGLLYVDDKQICELHMYRHESPRRGSLTITVYPTNQGASS